MNTSKKNQKHHKMNKNITNKYISIIATFLFALLINIQSAEAQFIKKLKKRAEEAAKETVAQKIENKAAEKTGNAMDSILNADKKIKRKKKSKKKKGKSKANGGVDNKNVSEEFKMYSKFDFVPGNKILLYDDFSLDNMGDFPSKWNTNGTGEIVTIDDEKWFMLIGKSTYIPDVSKSLPEEYTVEFDMQTNGLDRNTSSQAKLEMLFHDNNSFSRSKNMIKVEIPLAQYISAGFVVENSVNGQRVIRNTIGKDVRSVVLENTHVSIAVNGKRFRMWMNENKVIDVPRLVPDDISAFKIHPRALRDGQDQVFITNLKIADGGQDLRSKLLNDGKYSLIQVQIKLNQHRLEC
jgi:hypothetical protein